MKFRFSRFIASVALPPRGYATTHPLANFNGTKGALPLAGLIAEPNAQSN
jgi:hypothetical protein